MGTLIIKKYQNNNRTLEKSFGKWYGRIVHRETLNTNQVAEHIMKHGTIYTDDVVLGLTRKLMHCIAELLTEGYKVKLDGIGTLYLAATSAGVEDIDDFDASKHITRIGVKFLADQSNTSLFTASQMRRNVKLSSVTRGSHPTDDDDSHQGGVVVTPESPGNSSGNDGLVVEQP